MSAKFVARHIFRTMIFRKLANNAKIAMIICKFFEVIYGEKTRKKINDYATDHANSD